MKSIVNLRNAFYALILTCLVTVNAQAQQMDSSRMVVEMTLRNSNNSIVSKSSKLSSFSVSYTKPTKTEGKKEAKEADEKACYVVLTFLVMDIPILKTFTETTEKLDAEITITDRYGKFPNRKIILKDVVMDGMNDQISGDYLSSYMNLSCKELIVDGVKLKD